MFIKFCFWSLYQLYVEQWFLCFMVTYIHPLLPRFRMLNKLTSDTIFSYESTTCCSCSQWNCWICLKFFWSCWCWCCLKMDHFFDCLNVKNTLEYKVMQKPFHKTAHICWWCTFCLVGSVFRLLWAMEWILHRMINPTCLFLGNLMKDSKLQFTHSKKFASFYLNRVFHTFYLNVFLSRWFWSPTCYWSSSWQPYSKRCRIQWQHHKVSIFS